MERRTAMQSAGIFVVTVAAGLPFALQAGQWLADWPTSKPAGVPAPVATAEADAAGATGPTELPELVEEPQDPWYQPQRGKRPAAPSATPPGQENPSEVRPTPILEGSTAPPAPPPSPSPSTTEPTPDEPSGPLPTLPAGSTP